MAEREGLIERAAALLDGGRETAALSVPTTAPGDPEPLTRAFAIDRGQLAQAGIVLPSAMSSRLVEEFRIIKQRLISGWSNGDAIPNRPDRHRVVMVTSAGPSEGKTFNVVNLALALAADQELTVVLIDADLMRPGIAAVMGLPNAPGLSEILAGEIRLAEALVQTDLSNLIVLPAGKATHRTPELLSSRVMADGFAEISRRFRHVVVVLDTSPTLASSGPAALAPLVDEVVFVVEAGQTQQREIESSLSLLGTCQQISLLLNKSEARASEHFGSYSYYYRPRPDKGA